MKNKVFPALAALFFAVSMNGQTLFDPTIINKIEVEFPFSDWDARLDTAEAGVDDFIHVRANCAQLLSRLLDQLGL